MIVGTAPEKSTVDANRNSILYNTTRMSLIKFPFGKQGPNEKIGQLPTRPKQNLAQVTALLDTFKSAISDILLLLLLLDFGHGDTFKQAFMHKALYQVAM